MSDELTGDEVYMGNSVSYIYTKMQCYKDQVGMAFDALRALGCDMTACADNNERRDSIRRWVRERQESVTIVESTYGNPQVLRALDAAYQVLGMIPDPPRSAPGVTRLAFYEVRRARALLRPIDEEEETP